MKVSFNHKTGETTLVYGENETEQLKEYLEASKKQGLYIFEFQRVYKGTGFYKLRKKPEENHELVKFKRYQNFVGQ